MSHPLSNANCIIKWFQQRVDESKKPYKALVDSKTYSVFWQNNPKRTVLPDPAQNGGQTVTVHGQIDLWDKPKYLLRLDSVLFEVEYQGEKRIYRPAEIKGSLFPIPIFEITVTEYKGEVPR